MKTTRYRLVAKGLCILLACGCGGKDRQDGDADTDEDTSGDVSPDMPPDIPPDTAPDPDAVEDPDTLEDTGEEDTVTDTEEDPSADPVDDSAADVVDEDVAAEVTDVPDMTSETTCTGTPYIARSDKGPEFTAGACNPDGSWTEALVVTDLGSCCIHVDHYCAWMNCCTTLSPSLGVTTMPRSVSVTETETGTFCRCEGWFSPEYEICGLAPGTWTVRIGTLWTTVTVT